jgi:hypothetical protein
MEVKHLAARYYQFATQRPCELRCQPIPHPLLVDSFLTAAVCPLVGAADTPGIPIKFATAIAATANRKFRIYFPFSAQIESSLVAQLP